MKTPQPKDNTVYKLSTIQLEALKSECPNCEQGILYPVSGDTKEEDILHCTCCLLSMDSDGGIIK